MKFCNKTTGSFASSNQQNQIQYFIYTPKIIENNTKPRAMIQLVHGMAEHIERYEPYIEFLTSQGYLVYGDNHLGHKGSVKDESELGFFAEKEGWQCLIDDEIELTCIMKEKHPALKVYLYGHSMGSFITRMYMVQNAELMDGVILSGTAGGNSGLSVLRSCTKVLGTMRGTKNKSTALDKLMFGSFNSKYNQVNNTFDWLTQDTEVVSQYTKDPYSGFPFTYGGFYDLQTLLQQATSKEWFNKVPLELPILIISGKLDPVGGWGRGIQQIDKQMKRLPCQDYEMHLFENMRHEIHNELEKQQVWDYVSSWLNKRC